MRWCRADYPSSAGSDCPRVRWIAAHFSVAPYSMSGSAGQPRRTRFAAARRPEHESECCPAGSIRGPAGVALTLTSASPGRRDGAARQRLYRARAASRH